MDFSLRSKPLGRNAKNPDGTSRCNAAGRSPVDDQSERRPRRRLGGRHGAMPHGRNIRERQFFKHSGRMKAGASHECHHSTSRGDDCVAVHPRSAKSRVGVGDGRGRQNQRGCRWLAREAAGSDKAIDRDFSGPAGFTTDCATVGAR